MKSQQTKSIISKLNRSAFVNLSLIALLTLFFIIVSQFIQHHRSILDNYITEKHTLENLSLLVADIGESTLKVLVLKEDDVEEAFQILSNSEISSIPEIEPVMAALRTDVCRLVSLYKAGDIKSAKAHYSKNLSHRIKQTKQVIIDRKSSVENLHRDKKVEMSRLNNYTIIISILFALGVGVFSFILNKDFTQSMVKTRAAVETANFELTQMNEAMKTEAAQYKQKEKGLISAKLAAEAASLAKSDFLENMSHEIRTPLNAVIGMTDLTLETELTSEQREYLKMVQSSSEGLLSLINDILNFSKIEAGKMEIEEIEFNLREVVEKAVEIFSLRAETKRIDLLCYVAPEVPDLVVGDPTRLKQVIVNLIGNAIKFTDVGEVAIKVEPSSRGQSNKDKDKKVALHFEVSDTGIGISKKDIGKIFKKFTQADASTTRRFGGSGLGLNISKSLIELMGGELWVKSKKGIGSKFQFNLNLNMKEESLKKRHDSYPDFKEFTVLVVDGNETNRFILRRTLGALGMQVKEAKSDSQALAVLKECKKPIHLVILDYQLPDINGVELARKIRKRQRFKDIKIIMLSSLGGSNSELKQNHNISEIITKPVMQSKLLDMLVSVLQSNKQEESITAEKKVKAERPKKDRKNVSLVKDNTIKEKEHAEENKCPQSILLVEDNKANQELAKRILQKAGYLVDIAENGALALEAIQKSSYDLVLMDVYMPVMDGLEATKKIRAWEHSQKKQRIPILALTAHAIEGYREKCLNNGMDDYITKPIRKRKLLEAIDHWIYNPPTVVDDTVPTHTLIEG